MKYIYVKDNLKKVSDKNELVLKVNGKEIWNTDNRIEISFDEAKKYSFKLYNKDGKVIVKKEFDDEQLESKFIYVVTRKAHPWTGMRGALYSWIVRNIFGDYTIKLKKTKEGKDAK